MVLTVHSRDECEVFIVVNRFDKQLKLLVPLRKRIGNNNNLPLETPAVVTTVLDIKRV